MKKRPSTIRTFYLDAREGIPDRKFESALKMRILGMWGVMFPPLIFWSVRDVDGKSPDMKMNVLSFLGAGYT